MHRYAERTTELFLCSNEPYVTSGVLEKNIKMSKIIFYHDKSHLIL